MAVAQRLDEIMLDGDQIAAILGFDEDFAEGRRSGQGVHGGGVGDKDFVFGISFAAAAVFYGTDDSKVQALDLEEFSDGVGLSEQFFGRRFRQHCDMGIAVDVVVGEHDAAVDLVIGDQYESGRDAEGLGGGVTVAIFGLNACIDQWGDGLDVGDIAQGEGVLDGKILLSAADDAAAAASARFDHQLVGPERFDPVHRPAVETADDRQHGDDRRHAHDHAKHRKHRAQFVGQKAFEGDFDDHPKEHGFFPINYCRRRPRNRRSCLWRISSSRSGKNPCPSSACRYR